MAPTERSAELLQAARSEDLLYEEIKELSVINHG